MKDFYPPRKKKTTRFVTFKNAVETTGVFVFFRSLIFLASLGFILASIAYLIYGSFNTVTNDNIVIIGNRALPPKIIFDLIHAEGRSLNQVDVYDLKIAAEKFPWIKNANVNIRYPSTIVIQITEQTPVAFYRIADHIYMLNKERMILPVLFNKSGWNLPVIEDSTLLGILKPGEIVRYPTLISAMELLDLFEQNHYFNSDMVAGIDISDIFDIKVKTFGRKFLIHFGYDKFSNKIKNLYYAIPKIDALKNVHNIDLRYKNKVIVK